MRFRVVCISRAIAAGGEAVGRLVAERLGFRYVDEQIIVRAGELARVDPARAAAVEKRQPLLQRLVDKLSAAQDMMGPVTLGTLFPVGSALTGTASSKTTPDEMRTLIRAAIHEVARRGEAVIVAHAASMALASVQGVLRVLVTASPETRARRLVDAEGISELDAAAAVTQSDRNRRDYFRRFYEIREERPTHYDLILNTDVLTPEQAAGIVVFATRGDA